MSTQQSDVRFWRMLGGSRGQYQTFFKNLDVIGEEMEIVASLHVWAQHHHGDEIGTQYEGDYEAL